MTSCMYLQVSFEVCLLPRSLQQCVHAGTIVSGRRDRLLSPSPFSLSSFLSVMLVRPVTHGASSGKHLVVNGKAPLAGALSLYVCASFSASQKNRTVQNRNRGLFPKTEPKPTDLGHRETVTTLTSFFRFLILSIP